MSSVYLKITTTTKWEFILSTRILKEKVFPHLLEKKSKKIEIYFVSIWHISED